MGLKTVLDSLDGVDDAFHALYRQGEGGKLVLDVEDYDAHPSVRAMKNAFEATKTAKAEAQAKLAALEAKVTEIPEDFDAAKWHEFKAAAEKTKGDKDKEVANLTQLHESRVAALQAKYDADIAAREAAIADRDATIDRTHRDTELTNLLVKHHVKEELLEGARLLVGAKITTVRGEDGQRTNIVPTNLGDLPLADYVKSWASGDEGKPWVQPATGPAAPGGGRGTGNRINRADFLKLPPAKQAEMAQQAGRGELRIED